jgi:YegS/Rv2252/BmrU family lipid kinase
MAPSTAGTVVVLNPVSGSGDHADAVHRRATLNDYDVRETEGEGDAVRFAAEAAEAGADVVAAAGGDGTLNEVVRGLDRADALGSVTVGVVPVGTGNDFAGHVGIADIDEAFHVLEDGERRHLDLGVANGRPFVNSCVAGLTADASSETTPEMKSKYGVLAYVLNTIENVAAYEGLTLDIEAWGTDRDDPSWSGEAITVLVGNGRRFTMEGSSQAHLEDGKLELTVVENAPRTELVGEALLERLLDREAAETVRLQAAALEISVLGEEPASFSLDGEIIDDRHLTVETRPSVLRFAVGDGYDPDPGSL